MYIQTHLFTGWCFAHCFALSLRERLLCILAATLPDLDGLGMLKSDEMYWEYHHKLGHNLLAGIVLAGLLAACSRRRLWTFPLYLALFHLHLLLDYFGSGPYWGIYYLWPFSRVCIEFQRAWLLYSWQNISVGIALFLWSVGIVYYRYWRGGRFARRDKASTESTLPLSK